MLRMTYLFIEGIKPAMLVTLNELEYTFLKHRGFPSFEFYFEHNKEHKQVLFFQNEEQKKDFINAFYLAKNADEQNRLVGKTVGFPEAAINAYPVQRANRLLFDYHGIQFASHIDNFENDLKWLKNTYQIPKHLKTSVIVKAFNETGKGKYVFYKENKEGFATTTC